VSNDLTLILAHKGGIVKDNLCLFFLVGSAEPANKEKHIDATRRYAAVQIRSTTKEVSAEEYHATKH